MTAAYNIGDLRNAAKRRLPRGLFEYVDRGAEDERALANNRRALDDIRLLPRVLQDVSTRSMASSLFGQPLALPIVAAPTAVAGLLWHDGDVALAKAAAQAGIPFSLSTASVTAMEDVSRRAGGRLWFQLYVFHDRNHTRSLIERAAAASYEALILTVDTALVGKREYNTRNGFTVPLSYAAKTIADFALHPRWLFGVAGRYAATTGMPKMTHYPNRAALSSWTSATGNRLDPSFSWKDVAEIRRLWAGRLIVKGVLRPEDAAMAVEHGADAVVVSNHGGRVLDAAPAPMEMLPAILRAVNSRAPVMVDGAFTRGSDVVKAIALGAAAVLVGRAHLWGVASGGQEGAAKSIALFAEEIDRVLGQVGCPALSGLDPSYVRMPQRSQSRHSEEAG
jgi:isopentenyl diphosphate isomerase/L-lactate dehydrogenase-like FMN-dependent dehydrogenase